MNEKPGFAPRDGRLPSRTPLTGQSADRQKGRGRRAVERTLEILLALLLMLMCFCVFLVMLDRAFPAATGLGEMFQVADSRWNSTRQGWLTGDERSDWRQAVLSTISNEVLRKASGQVAWDPARNGVKVTEGDGVQTRLDGTATLTFDRNDWLRVGRNSLVILQNPDEDDAASSGLLDVIGGDGAASRTASLTLVQGEVWGNFTGEEGGAVKVDIPGQGSQLVVTREPGDGNQSRFRVKLGPDHTASITVYAGRATVTIGQRTLQLGPSQYVAVLAGEIVGNVRTLLAPPVVLAPEDGRGLRFREFPPAVRFRWAGAEANGLQRLEIARDPDFREVVLDETVEGDSLTLGSLPPGEYMWRVSVLHAGAVGAPSRARRLSLVRDDLSPPLQVTFPRGVVGLDRCLVEGITEPEARVFVAGELVPPRVDGRFSVDTPLRPGTNLLIVEAVDAAGNSTYRSQIVRRVLPH